MSGGKRIQHQGALDRLCGPYSIVNALSECGVGNPRAVFKTCIEALSRKRQSELVWDGTDYDDLKKMLKGLSRQLQRRGISVSYPFDEEEPSNAAHYWGAFDELFADRRSIVAVLGLRLSLRKPLYHLTVARPQGGRIEFLDSQLELLRTVKNRPSLHIGQRNKAAKWLIDPSALILFQKAPQ